jgi:sugar O-acyltransferase (sialic acid O-acetyltransferase NeuD family)
MKQAVFGIGAGGHAKGLIEILQADPQYELVGMLDANLALMGTHILGVPILGDESLMPDLFQKGIRLFFIGVGSVGDVKARVRIFESALAAGFEQVSCIHASAIVSPSARLGRGVMLLAGVVVNPESVIGENVILNTSAVVEHDCVVGRHAHISTGARLCGTVTVGEGAHVGAGATIRQGIEIGAHAMVGAGAVVVKDVPAGVTVVGVPAKPVRHSG